MKTNNGNCAAACSLNFSKPPNFYDTFALRDVEGHQRLIMTHPYFMSRESRSAMIWLSLITSLQATLLGFPCVRCIQRSYTFLAIFDSSPFNAASPLRFRGIADSLATHHLEGSECCLIHPRWLRSRGLCWRTFIGTMAFTAQSHYWHMAKSRPTLGYNCLVEKEICSQQTGRMDKRKS